MSCGAFEQRNMKENKKGFKLSKVNWIFALVAIGISSLVFLRRDGINGFSLSYLFVSIIMAGIIPLIFALCVWLIKGKKEYSGTYTFNIILFLICFGMLKESDAINKETTDTVNLISKSVLEYKNSINNEDDGVSAYKNHIANVDEGIVTMIRNSSGNEQEVYRNLQKFISIYSSVMINWQNSFDSVMQPRILDYSVLNNRTEFEYQIDVLKHYKNQSELYKSTFEKRKSLIEDFNKDIPKGNLTLKGVMKGIKNKDSIQKPVFRPFINSHIEYSSNLIAVVEFLQIIEGKWEYKNEELIFNSVELEERYSTFFNKIEENENRINELSDKLIEVM